MLGEIHVAGLLDIDWVLIVVGLWLLVALAGAAALDRMAVVSRVLFPLGAAGALLLAAAALHAAFDVPQVAVLPLGLPGLPFHLRLDPLAAFFLFTLGAAGFGVSLFAAGYFRQGEGTPPGLLCLHYHLFLASMALVMLADDAYLFMVAWESMALSSFFLVTANHRIAEIRRAGYLYLLIAHVGAIAILLCFGVLQAGSGDYTFAGMRAQLPSADWAAVAFVLAVLGFGAKAGFVPLHVWLPDAHPAAPSPVSAVMSGLMLKTAIYGLLRVTLDLSAMQAWWWGVLLLALGVGTALFGVVFAAAQTDMKRLLAYSSIENIGMIAIGIGLAVLFKSYAMPALAALALTAALYHVLAHAFFKSLLFVATGSVLHATGERNLGKLGGLLRFMPRVGWITLVAVMAGAGLPPMAGFVAEWLLLQSFLFSPGLPNPFLNMLVPAVAAAIALVAALGGYVMVKFYGVVFLGRPREEHLHRAHDADGLEYAGLLWLVGGCVLLGLLPTQVLALIDPVTRELVGHGLAGQAAAAGWWLLVPNTIERASYSPLLFLVGVAAAFVLAFVAVRRLYHGRIRRSPPWDCGFPWQTPRMQDTAEGFGQPIRQIFEPFFRMHRELPTPFDTAPRYEVRIEDHFWHWLYLPVARAVAWIGQLVGRLQRGRIAIYLLYSFATLIVMLILVSR